MWGLARCQGLIRGSNVLHSSSTRCDAAWQATPLLSTTFLFKHGRRRGRAIPQAGHRPEYSRSAPSCDSVFDRRCSCEQSFVLRDPLREHHSRVSVPATSLEMLQLANPRVQLIPGSTSEQPNTLYRMASTASGTGSMTVCLSAALPACPHTHGQRTHWTDTKNRNMASSRSRYWRYSLPRTDGDQRRHLPPPTFPCPSRRHS